MSLQERLAAIRAASAEKIPPEQKSVIQRSIDDLRASGILERMLPVGATVPRFSLPTSDGATVSIEQELARGPVILSFFRGSW